jgi:transposase
MAKIHRKVSGCFQSEEGARHFATIRSYLATAHKHDVGALEVLARLFRGDVWMPPART